MRLTAQIRGVDALSLRTKKLIAAAAQGMKFGVSEAAQLFVDAEKAIVPVDTGNLRDHIHAELLESTETKVAVVVSPVYEDPNEYGIDPAYARRIEFGFTGTDRLGRNYHQPAQPFVRPAWDENKAEADKVIRDSVYDALDAAQVKR